MKIAGIIQEKSIIGVLKQKLFLVPFLILSLVVLSLFVPGIPACVPSYPQISFADTAWMLTATALVLIMTPGLAFFYGGMVSKKNVISTMLQSFVSMVKRYNNLQDRRRRAKQAPR